MKENEFTQSFTRRNMRKEWETMIVNSNPKHFITITFTLPNIESTQIVRSVESVIKVTNKLLLWVNVALLGKNFRNKDYLCGIVALEKQANDQPHFHLLINNAIDHEILSSTFKEKIKKISIIHQEGFDCRPIINAKKDREIIANYTTKDMNIGILTDAGILF